MSSLKLIPGVQVTDEAGEQIRSVAGIILHPEFNEKSLINDVAVLLVAQPFELSESVGPVCLPAPGAVVKDNTECVATGHGKDQIVGYFTVKLRKVDLPIWSRAECEKSLNENYFQKNHSITWRIHESFLCAGGKESYDTCEGDGGGPLVCKANSLKEAPAAEPAVVENSVLTDDLDLRESSDGEDSPLVQVGVTAWGVSCGQAGLPSVYSSLASPAIRCWLDQLLSCYTQSDEVSGQFDLRGSEDLLTPDSQAGLSQAQCGSWLDRETSGGAACGCKQKLSLNSPDTSDTTDFDLRADEKNETE